MIFKYKCLPLIFALILYNFNIIKYDSLNQTHKKIRSMDFNKPHYWLDLITVTDIFFNIYTARVCPISYLSFTINHIEFRFSIVLRISITSLSIKLLYWIKCISFLSANFPKESMCTILEK